MAKNKIIPTWLKVAAVAALVVPYSVKTEKDENEKIKKISARSVTARITYVPKDGDKESELDVALFGAAKEHCGEAKGKRVQVNKDALRNDIAKLCDTAAEKAKSCAQRVAKSVSEFKEKYVTVVDTEENTEETEDIIVEADDDVFAEEAEDLA
ncbi:MAG: hypothetical protein IJC49_01275 [Clostridia bacterium]|nr:hypothetical protein [Clostridia bacterium]